VAAELSNKDQAVLSEQAGVHGDGVTRLSGCYSAS
jgi:hypothetical protein